MPTPCGGQLTRYLAFIRADPAKALTGLCASLAIPYTERMLHWPAGPKPYDGVWASHWYGEVHKSTGFGGAEGPLPNLTGPFADLAAQAMPSYQDLHNHVTK